MSSLNSSFDTSTESAVHSGDIKVFENKISMLEQLNFDLKMQVYYLNQKQNESSFNHSILKDANQTSNTAMIPSDYFDLKKSNKSYIRKIEELESSLIELQSQPHHSLTKASNKQASSSTSTIAVSVSNETKIRESLIASIITERDATLIQELHEQLTILQTKYIKASDMVDFCTDRIKMLQMEMNTLKNEIEEKNQSLILLEENNNLLKSQVISYNQINMNQVLTCNQLLLEKNNLEKALLHMNEQLMHARIENTELTGKIEDLVLTQEQIQQQYEELEKRNQKQEIQLIALNDMLCRKQLSSSSSQLSVSNNINNNHNNDSNNHNNHNHNFINSHNNNNNNHLLTATTTNTTTSASSSYSELSLDSILSKIEELSTSPYIYIKSNRNDSYNFDHNGDSNSYTFDHNSRNNNNNNNSKASSLNITTANIKNNSTIYVTDTKPSSSSFVTHNNDKSDRHIWFLKDSTQHFNKSDTANSSMTENEFNTINNNINKNKCNGNNNNNNINNNNSSDNSDKNNRIIHNNNHHHHIKEKEQDRQERFIDLFKQRELELMYALEEVAMSFCANAAAASGDTKNGSNDWSNNTNTICKNVK